MDIKIAITDKRIETKRFILRPWVESDLNGFYEYACVEGVGEMADWKHHTHFPIPMKRLCTYKNKCKAFS